MPTRKLTIESCALVYEGEGKKGPFKIYEIEARDEHGVKVQEKLRSFDELRPGLEAEFDITQRDDKYGRSYTLRLQDGAPRRSQATGPTTGSDLVTGQLASLEERVGGLEHRVKALEAKGSTNDHPQPSQQTLDNLPPEDDLPF